MKKISSFLIALFLLSNLSAMAASFPDVPEDHANYEAIEFLDDKAIIKGYEDGTFGPEDLVTRAQALKMIVLAFGTKHDGEYETLFADVKKDAWYFAYVMAAKEAGLVNGYEDGSFGPEDPVNLAQTLKMAMLAAKVKLPEKVDSDVFVDVSKDQWHAPFAYYAKQKNIVLSDDFGNISPAQAMTRASFAEIIFRLKSVVDDDGKAFSLARNWPTYKGKSLAFQIKYDPNWTIIENQNEVHFFKADKALAQFSTRRVYPNTALITVTKDKNDLSLSANQYFATLKDAFQKANYTEFKLSGLRALEILYPEKRTVDWYVYLGDGSLLAIYTEYGNGVTGFQSQQIIKEMLSTLAYSDSVPEADYSDLLSQIFEKILVEGKGMESLNRLPSKIIIETDTIGVGTGAIDYYYSEEVNHTFKYERASDVILAKREGRTTAF